MRVCIIGGGLAGTLLAWRLRRISQAIRVDLALGAPTTDATGASGGGVRSYEPDALARRYASESLTELLGSPTLRERSGFRRIGSTYLRTLWPNAHAEVAALPFRASLADPAELKSLGWAGLDDDVVGVIEPDAGHICPDAFRRALLDELAGDARVRIVASPARPLPSIHDTAVRCQVGSAIHAYDRVIVAAGPWTPQILTELGVPADACGSVKAIQYALCPARGERPTFFVDETTGLYGRPVDAGAMLLGVPVSEYGGPVDGGAPVLALAERAVRLASDRLPLLRLSAPRMMVRSADCYQSPFTLTLRQVEGQRGILTFSGGSGGSAKTALAASWHAAAQLADSVAPRPPVDARTPDASADFAMNALREG